MAELRNAEVAVAALETTLATLRQFQHNHTAEENAEAMERLRGTLQSMRAALGGDLDATMDKFRERMKLVDPITNEPRFGPKTMARVSEMLQTYDVISKEAIDQELLATVQHRIDAFDATKANEAARTEELQRQEVVAREAALQQQMIQQQREEAEREMQKEKEREAEQQRMAVVARLAQLKREERERQRLAEETLARDEHERLARENARVEVGVGGLSKAVERLCSGLDGESSLLHNTLDKLQILLANICSSPENAAFRHIPKDNPHFHTDIGQHDGGYACLLAMGFKELETEPSKRVFIMEEPELSEDFDKWSRWFDGLKAMKEWIEGTRANTKNEI